MEKTIYNVYVVMESQEQCNRMKQLCIDNNLRYWKNSCAFQFNNFDNTFSFSLQSNEFFVLAAYEISIKTKTEVTENEFIELLIKEKEQIKTPIEPKHIIKVSQQITDIENNRTHNQSICIDLKDNFVTINHNGDELAMSLRNFYEFTGIIQKALCDVEQTHPQFPRG